MAKKLKVGVIGAGMIARWAHFKGYAALPDDVEVVAICDLKPEAREAAKKEWGFDAKLYEDYRELLADKEIDAVSVSTPNAAHCEPTILALQAGKHVLCEKPLAMNAEEGKRMCRAAKDSGKILQVGLQNRLLALSQFMKEYVDHGHMGEIYYARARALRRRGVPGWGVFTDKVKQGGGPLIDIGVHILDLTLYFMGYPKPVSATGMTTDRLAKNPANRNFWGEFDREKFTVEDFAAGMIRFENGAMVTLESSFMANVEEDHYDTQLFGTDAGAFVNVSGNSGMVGVQGLKLFKQVDGQYFEMKPGHVPSIECPYVEEVKAFVKAIQEGLPSPVPGENGLALNAIFDALYKSAASGKEEAVDVSY